MPPSRRPGGAEAEAEAGRPGSRRLLAPTDSSPGWASPGPEAFRAGGQRSGISLRGGALASALINWGRSSFPLPGSFGGTAGDGAPRAAPGPPPPSPPLAPFRFGERALRLSVREAFSFCPVLGVTGNR